MFIMPECTLLHMSSQVSTHSDFDSGLSKKTSTFLVHRSAIIHIQVSQLQGTLSFCGSGVVHGCRERVLMLTVSRRRGQDLGQKV